MEKSFSQYLRILCVKKDQLLYKIPADLILTSKRLSQSTPQDA